MINKITVTNPLGQSVDILLRNPERSGFLIKRIDGLDPSVAVINTTELASQDGSLFNSSRVMSRNIVFSIGLRRGVDTVETLRQKTYKYFPLKKNIEIVIESDNRTCKVVGYVESNNIDIFSKDVTAQISVICPDAYFYAAQGTLTLFSGVDPLFEFPFSNESTVSPLIEFGDIQLEKQKNIYYEGDADVGLVMYIHAIGTVEEVTIVNVGTNESMYIDTDKLYTLTGNYIIDGDDIIISTVKGGKFIYLLRNGVYTNILNCLDLDSEWFQLTKGDNVFSYAATVGESYLQFEVIHNTLYEGV